MNVLMTPETLTASGQTPPPLGLLYMAANADCVIFDGALKKNAREFLERHKPDVVGVSALTMCRHNALDILRVAKRVGCRTVMGGAHVATSWKQLAETYEFIDHLVIGDGELAWKAICENQTLPKVIRMPVPDLDALPLPAWDKINIEEYNVEGNFVHRGNDLRKLPRVSIVLGRGCVGRCKFCSTWWVNGKYRAHKPEWIERQIDYLWNLGVRHLVFQDDCLTADRQATINLCNILGRYNFSWSGATRCDLVDEELVRMMESAGCYELAFGIESGSASILKRMNKEINISRAFEAREICRRAKIAFVALVMQGYPGETLETKREDMEFLEKLRPDEVSTLGYTMILPGTALYTEMKKQSFITDDFWLGEELFFVYEKEIPAGKDLHILSHGPQIINRCEMPVEGCNIWFKASYYSKFISVVLNDIELSTIVGAVEGVECITAAIPADLLASLPKGPVELKLYHKYRGVTSSAAHIEVQ